LLFIAGSGKGIGIRFAGLAGVVVEIGHGKTSEAKCL
jgi:hypothetical protein